MNSSDVVVGLGFGDEGKGTIVDFLAHPPGREVTVVRHNGGAQAAHNVVTPAGQHHMFAQFGSGLFAGAATHLSRFMLFNPSNLTWELDHLDGLGIPDAMETLTIDPNALVITGFHRAAGRLRELARGDGRHGSCGQGIGETASLALQHPDSVLRAGELADRALTIERLHHIQKLLVEDMIDSGIPRGTEQLGLGTPWLEAWSWFAASSDYIEELYDETAEIIGRLRVASDIEVLTAADHVIFEGAQGVMLDEDFGHAPHTTWSKTTSLNAHTLMDEAGYTGTRRTIGVTRTYGTRHGPGPFSEHAEVDFPELHNEHGDWQGGWRQGWLNVDVLNYAIKADERVDCLAVTHLDHLRPGWKVTVDQKLEECDHAAFGDVLAEQTHKPVLIGSWGPTARDKRWL